jgi:hypothetical protein
MYGSLIEPLYNVMVTDVPAAMPFKTHVSHGLLRGLRPPVPLPEMVVVLELTADATLAAKSSIASDAAIAETKVCAVNRRADERRERTDAHAIRPRLLRITFTTNSATELYFQTRHKRQCG